MNDYYRKILQKMIDSNDSLDDFVIKQIVNVVDRINHVDFVMSVFFSLPSPGTPE